MTSSFVQVRSCSKQPDSLRRQLARQMTKTIADYQLIAPGDRIMVAVSGGKDSYTLLDLLQFAQKRAPFQFSINAVHLDQKQPGYDGKPLATWLQNRQVEYTILTQDTYSIVMDKTPVGKSYCRVCSRLRRGILYTAAENLKCNKIALGHHSDDAIETLLMNLFFAGKLQAMPACYTTDDQRFQVIRPLIECMESDIASHAAYEGYPLLPCNLCGSQKGLQREEMKKMIKQLAQKHPHIRSVMLHALKNVKASHLLDQSLMR